MVIMDYMEKEFEIGNPIEDTRYYFKNDYNVIEGCIFRHTSCEHINIREYNTGN